MGNVLAKSPTYDFKKICSAVLELLYVVRGTCDESSTDLSYNFSLRALQQEISSSEIKGGVKSSVKLLKMF